MQSRLRAATRLAKCLIKDGNLESVGACQVQEVRWMGRLPFVDQPSTVTRGLYPQVQKQMEEEAGRKLTRADQAETARAVTNSFMFPWEKRQMDGEGTPLRWWEKMYWWVFAGGSAYLLFSLSARWREPEAVEEIDEELEARKQAAARAALVGTQGFHIDDDPFEGLSPEEIQEYVQQQTGASDDDPFEGMSPEEINAWVEEHGGPPKGL